MVTRRSVLALSVVLFGASAFALMHPVALSAACCAKFLTSLVFFESLDHGVPAYLMGMGDETFSLQDASSFTVTDHNGTTESVEFDASQFADLGAATPEEVRDAINAQLTVGEALVENGMLMLRGQEGGLDAAITLDDGPGGPLAALGFEAGTTMTGTEDIELRLATNLDDGMGGGSPMGGFPHHPYIVVMSSTPGSLPVAGFTLPLALDATTMLAIRATLGGALPGFVGDLDANGDALTAFDTALLPKMFPAGTPDRLYFAFVVFSQDLTGIELVSNLFQVEMVH